MTKKQLIVLRQESYTPPPEVRCENCKHANYFKDSCLAIRIRNSHVVFFIHPAGCCDLFEQKATK